MALFQTVVNGPCTATKGRGNLTVWFIAEHMQFYMALYESSGAQIELGMLQMDVSESFFVTKFISHDLVNVMLNRANM